MARYIGTISSDMRGKVGGLVTSRARGGTTLKAHAVPVQTGSLLQAANRTAMAGANAAWKDLSGTDQSGWALWAATLSYTNSLGQAYSPTALQLYTQAWFYGKQFGVVPTSTPTGSYPAPQPITNALLIVGGGAFQFEFTPSGGSYPDAWLLYLSRPLSSAVTYSKTIARRLIAVRNASNFADIAAAYTTAYGSLPARGVNISVRIVPVTYGYFVSGTIFNSIIQTGS
jgi:hypothetical protein